MPLDKRGELTPEMQDLAVDILGFEISQVELDFMPTFLSELSLRGNLDVRKLTYSQVAILDKWCSKALVGHYYERHLNVDFDFWQSVGRLVWNVHQFRNASPR